MPVVFTRVDDRLIHGQIVQGWLPGMNVDEFVVVLEEADAMVKDLMRLALPPEYGLKILNAADAAEYIKNSPARIFLLVEDFESLDKVIKNGVKLNAVNIGGLHYRDGRENVFKDVFMSARERDFVKNLINSGVKIDGRSVPKEAHADLKDILCR